jgi:hypothetical protein
MEVGVSLWNFDLQGGVQPFYVADFSTGTLPEGITFTRASTATYIGSDGLIKTASVDEPRFDYNPANSMLRGILVEGARTNYLLNSGAPATQTTASLPTGTYTLSVVGSGSATSSAGTAVGSNFGTATAGSPNVFTVSTSGTVTVTVSGSLTRFQLENGSFASSYIPTTGATATRAAESLTRSLIAGVGGFAPSVGGTLVAEWTAGQSGVQSLVARIASSVGTSDGTAVSIFQRNTTTPSFVESRDNFSSNPVINIGSGAAVVGTTYKVAFAFSDNDFAVSINGGSVSTSSSGTIGTVSTINGFKFGGRAADQFLFGWIRKVTFYNQRLSNDQLLALSA